MLEEHTLLSNRTRAANHTGILAGDSIRALVCAELVSCRGGVVCHIAWLRGVVGSRLVCGAKAELFAEGTGGFGHLVYLKCVCLDMVVYDCKGGKLYRMGVLMGLCAGQYVTWGVIDDGDVMMRMGERIW